MDKHTLKIYDEELALLDEKISQMGGLAEHQFRPICQRVGAT